MQCVKAENLNLTQNNFLWIKILWNFSGITLPNSFLWIKNKKYDPFMLLKSNKKLLC